MKALIQAIKTQLATVTELKTIRVYNNQFDLVEDQQIYSFAWPCAFIEIVNEQPAHQLGAGFQVFDPVIVRIHIGHEYYNGDGTQEENLDVFDLKDKVYKALQKFEPDGASAFFRSAENQDYTHTNLYHYIMDFTTTWIDSSMVEPVNGVTKDPPTGLEIIKTV